MASNSTGVLAAVSGKRAASALSLSVHRERDTRLVDVPTHDVLTSRDAQTSQYHFHLWTLGTSLLSLGRAPGLSGSNPHHAWRPSQRREKTHSAHRTGRV